MNNWLRFSIHCYFSVDNRRKKPRQRQRQLEYNVFDSKQEVHGPRISQQVAFAAYQFLSTGQF